MRIISFFLCVIILFASCEKEDIKQPPSNTDIVFLGRSKPSFTAKLDTSTFYWEYGLQDFQMIYGYQNGNGISDSANPVKMVRFGLTSGDSRTRFSIYSPNFNTSDPEAYKQVFNTGKKKLGNIGKDFYLTIQKDGVIYQSISTDVKGEVEIIKTEEFVNEFYQQNLRVWFKINGKLSSCSCQTADATLSDGLMITNFWGYKR